jgi:uncharacterized SAM-binding protein YcdF (DUF218 family)
MSRRPLYFHAHVPEPRSNLRRALLGLALGACAGQLFFDVGLVRALPVGGGRVLWVLGFAVAGAILWSTRLRAPLAAGLALLALLWLAVAFTPLTRLVASGLVRRDAPAPADAVFVLASGIQLDGELGSIGLARLHHGLAMVRAGHAPRLVVSNIADRPSHAAAVAAAIRALGLEIELHEVGAARDTHDEAVMAARLFAERGWRRVLLVTSPLHSRRGAETFEKQGLVVISSPAPETEFDLETLAWFSERLEAFGPALHERVGLVVYRWRGWL